MKLNIQAQLARIDWRHVRSASLVPCSILFGIALIVATVFGKEASKRSAAQKPARVEKVLYIGDSLSVDTFGELISQYLMKTFHGNVAFYASCGSSPENWLSDEPVFVTKCGYREFVPPRPLIYGDPMRHSTPKIERLLREQQPTYVIVQQGTNWMDRSLNDEKINGILDRFIGTIHRNANCKIIWITPPDSARFRSVQGRISTLIRQHQHRDDPVIDSRRLSGKYIVGKTGGDGVHYRSEAATLWAHNVIPVIDYILTKPSRKVADNERIIQLLKGEPDLDAD